MFSVATMLLLSCVRYGESLEGRVNDNNCRDFGKQFKDVNISKYVIFQCSSEDRYEDVLGGLAVAATIAVATNRNLGIDCLLLAETFDTTVKFSAFNSYKSIEYNSTPPGYQKLWPQGSRDVELAYDDIDWKPPFLESMKTFGVIYFHAQHGLALKHFERMALSDWYPQQSCLLWALFRPSPSAMRTQIRFVNSSHVTTLAGVFRILDGDGSDVKSVGVHVAVPPSLQHVVDFADILPYSAQYLRQVKLFLRHLAARNAKFSTQFRQLHLVVTTNAVDRVGLFRWLSNHCASLVKDIWVVDVMASETDDETLAAWLLLVRTDIGMYISKGAAYSGLAASAHILRRRSGTDWLAGENNEDTSRESE